MKNPVYRAIYKWVADFKSLEQSPVLTLHEVIQKEITALTEEEAKSMLASHLLKEVITEYINPITKMNNLLKDYESTGNNT